MSKALQKMAQCQICHEEKRITEMMPAVLVHESIIEMIRKDTPDWSAESYICLTDLNRFRDNYIHGLLVQEQSKLSNLQQEVMDSMKQQDLIAQNINSMFDRQLTLGERVADNVAAFGGSWKFIILFAILLALWLTFNTLVAKPFDPYPYILMNLILSCLAAIQAPIIMMSQNRQEDRDRMRGENDYKVNMKAELEIRHLHGKIDLLMTDQWQRLLAIQNIQMEMMEEMMERSTGAKPLRPTTES